MVEKERMGIMKIINNETIKKEVFSQIELLVTIDELDDLIEFFKSAKKQFVKRRNDCSIKLVKLENDKIKIEKITGYSKLIASGNDLIEDHIHFKDWTKKKDQECVEPDIVVHTMFKAKQNIDDTFDWANVVD